MDNFKSVSEFEFMLNGCVVCLNGSKQNTITDSATNAEYIATSCGKSYLEAEFYLIVDN